MATNDETKEQAAARAQADAEARARAKAKEREAAQAREPQAQAAPPRHGPDAGEHPTGYVEAADVNALSSSSIELPQGQEPDDAQKPPVGLPQTVAAMEKQRITREAGERETAQREVLESGDVEKPR